VLVYPGFLVLGLARALELVPGQAQVLELEMVPVPSDRKTITALQLVQLKIRLTSFSSFHSNN